jgi:hypothetical protein
MAVGPRHIRAPRRTQLVSPPPTRDMHPFFFHITVGAACMQHYRLRLAQQFLFSHVILASATSYQLANNIFLSQRISTSHRQVERDILFSQLQGLVHARKKCMY